MDSQTLQFLLERGPLLKTEILQRLAIQSEELEHWISDLKDQLVTFGSEYNLGLALKRKIRDKAYFPIWEISQDGNQVLRLGDLISVQPLGYVMHFWGQHQLKECIYSTGLPWWLYDIRPQGFIGRAFAHKHAEELNLPKDLKIWSDDDVLIAVSGFNEETIGNLILGNAGWSSGASALMTLEHLNASTAWSSDRITLYKHLAHESLGTELVGSSAGGEQPKFTIIVKKPDPTYVLVKFTAPDNNAATRRWGSLLQAETLASKILQDAGITSARSEFLQQDGQYFLEVERFDRVRVTGRLGLASLAALDHEFVGRNDASWSFQGIELHKQGLISLEDAKTMQKLEAFGRMIGNADMHLGNLSFFHERTTNLRLAPTYDMLPMLFAPRASGHIPHEVPEIDLKFPPDLEHWQTMFPWAMQYWQQLAKLPQPDESFKAIALKFIERLHQLKLKLDF